MPYQSTRTGLRSRRAGQQSDERPERRRRAQTLRRTWFAGRWDQHVACAHGRARATQRHAEVVRAGPALAWGEKETVAEVTGERRQAVSVTLQTAYDDWTVAEVAKVLGKQKEAAYFTKLAHNYQNVWNPVTQFMSPKSSDGNWVEPFDPKLGCGQGGRDYTTEVDSWLYTFSVQHDPEGLIQLMGGRSAFNARPDQLLC